MNKTISILFEIPKSAKVNYFALMNDNFEFTRSENPPTNIVFCDEEYICHKNGYYVFSLSQEQRLAVSERKVKIHKFY